MNINKALKVLADGHTIWRVKFAKEVCETVGVPFDKKLIQKFSSDPEGTFKGLVMYPGKENKEEVDGLSLSDYVTSYFKLTDKAGSFIGRGFQAKANAEVIKQKLLEEGYKANAGESKKLAKLARRKQISILN